jgi:glycosidase
MIRFDFHVSRAAREKYRIDKSLFSITGKVILSDYQQARVLSQKINSRRKEEGNFDQYVTAGQINALGLLHEVFHLILRNYEENENPGVFHKALDHLKTEITENNLDKTLLNFVEEFPPLNVYNGEITSQEYLNQSTEGKSNKEIILEEIILLHLENINPAASSLRELFADDNLIIKTSYKQLIEKTENFFDTEKPSGFGGLHLFKLLRKPVSANPYDLEKQLDFIKTEWGVFLGEKFLVKLLRGVDLIREDYKLFVPHGGGEKATPPIPSYDTEMQRLRLIREKIASEKKLSEDEKRFYVEYEMFTEDTHWIPEVVMIAKNVYVWMHQLSEKYKIQISRLDQIPDEELDLLAQWNFNALWLIGIWKRSSASKKIKHLTGNISAVSSAYSLYDYVIAEEIGGESAFQNLKDRAWVRGIRMASDMVPNHTGIYSKWVIEKPDYFLQRDDSPYPNYSFTGPNLSEDNRIEIRIEDQYYTRKDAAVVFQRMDNYTGSVKYIYHGNDGTNMPWNDTAQLNLLNPEVRESLIQTIMHVAQKTPIIRFDAAMTLAKKHYQRLWFPQPGAGGAIPSRTDYSMTLEQFNRLLPNEFWREVVDRINTEMPNVLLLAEAFWLMEGYFVRTLGMHRVYNSAFMHMMMKEENDKYKQLIKNTLEFNPEILKRYVNFMSNPDEETAINQFGKGDKYFGVAVLMSTLPGLPMFGHGQIEGFSEKYGMEYQRAYYDELSDEHLIHRHQREIFPLLKKRYFFSQVENFQFYDFIDDEGNVNNNVFAFSNRNGDESALVIYNNSFDETEGCINYSVRRVHAGNEGSLKEPEKLFSLFGFKSKPEFFYEYTDHRTQLKYMISGNEINEHGFRLHLFGYQYRVCLNFREIYDRDGKYRQLYHHLNGRGVYSLENALKEMELIPLHSAVENFVSVENIEKFRNYLTFSQKVRFKKTPEPEVPVELKEGITSIINEFKNSTDNLYNDKELIEYFTDQIKSSRNFHQIWTRYNKRKTVTKWMSESDSVLPVNSKIAVDENLYLYFLSLVFTSIINSSDDKNLNAEKLFEKLMLDKPLHNALQKNLPDTKQHLQIELFRFLLTVLKLLSRKNIRKRKTAKKKPVKEIAKGNNEQTLLKKLISDLLKERIVHNFIHVNEFEGITYFNKERFELAVRWIFQFAILNSYIMFLRSINYKNSTSDHKSKAKLTNTNFESELFKKIKTEYLTFNEIIQKAGESGFDLNKFKRAIKS